MPDLKINKLQDTAGENIQTEAQKEAWKKMTEH